MPEFQDYTAKSAHEIDGDDITLFLVDGVTHRTTADEMAKRGNIAIINSQAGSYTPVIGDLGKYVLMSSGSANTFTVPPNSSVAFPVGTQITVVRTGAGVTTIAQGSGVNIETANENLEISSQYSAMVLLKTGTDTWIALGGGAAGSSLPQLSTPASLTMTADGENDMDFAWSDVANEDGFEVQIAEDSGFTVNVQTANKSAAVLTHSFTGLTEGTTYYGRVKAEGDGVTYSDSGYATDSEDTDAGGVLAPLNAPGSFNAVVDGSDIDLTWTDTNTSPDESSLEIRRNTSNTTAGSTLINSPAANATSYTDVAPGTGTWYYFIRAVGNGTTTGNSSYASDSVTLSASYDSDAQAYITAEETASSTSFSTPLKDAIDDVFTAHKAAGLYASRLKALYLFTGTGLRQCKDPSDTDAAFRLTQLGGSAATILSNGMSFDGVNDGLNTHFIPADEVALHNESYAFALRGSVTTDACMWGGGASGSYSYWYTSDSPGLGENWLQGSGPSLVGSDTRTGDFVFTRRSDGSADEVRTTKANVQIGYASAVEPSAGTRSTVKLFLGCLNLNDNLPASSFNTGVISYYAIYDGLSDAEMTTVYNIMTAFLTATSR